MILHNGSKKQRMRAHRVGRNGTFSPWLVANATIEKSVGIREEVAIKPAQWCLSVYLHGLCNLRGYRSSSWRPNSLIVLPVIYSKVPSTSIDRMASLRQARRLHSTLKEVSHGTEH